MLFAGKILIILSKMSDPTCTVPICFKQPDMDKRKKALSASRQSHLLQPLSEGTGQLSKALQQQITQQVRILNPDPPALGLLEANLLTHFPIKAVFVIDMLHVGLDVNVCLLQDKINLGFCSIF